MKKLVQFVVLTFIISIVICVPGCGGGGGGGGGDTTGGGSAGAAPVVTFTSPASSGSVSYKENALPASISFSYSDPDGINSSSAKSTFTFRNTSFDLADLLNASASSASTSSDISPLYWTIAAKYNVSTGALITNYRIFGASGGASALLNLIDIDIPSGTLIVASNSRNKLIFINSTSGATIREVSLSASPEIIRTCPADGKVIVASKDSSTLQIYSVSTGDLLATPGLGAEPHAMVINKQTSIAYAIFANPSKDLSIIDCSAESVSSGTLQHLPQLVEAGTTATGNLYYAGGTGADRGIYLYGAGADTKLVSLDSFPESIACDSAGNRMSASYYGDDKVVIYDLSNGSAIAERTVGDQPLSVAVAQSAARVFSLNKGVDSVSSIDASSGALLSTISLAADPVGMVIDDTNGYLYVLENFWDITTTENGTLNVSVEDSQGNLGSTALNVTIEPVSSGDPGGSDPGTPDS